MILLRILTLMVLCAGSLILPPQLYAETRYVSDVLVISLRDEPGRSASILGHLQSGKALEVLEKNEDGYLFVKTDDGKQGWIPTRYTTTSVPKEITIDRLTAQVTALQQQIQEAVEQKQKITTSTKTRHEEMAQLQETNEQLVRQIEELQVAVKTAEANFITLQEKSKGVTEVYAERDALLSQNVAMKQKNVFLEAENEDLVQTGRILWFLAGFGVFLIGWIMGKMGRKQRHSSLSL